MAYAVLVAVYTLAFIGLAAVASWLLHRRRRRSASAAELEASRSEWVHVPLASAVVLWVVTVLTFGAGVLLAPAGVGLTFVASRRTSARNRGFLAGTVLNACLAIGFVLAIGILIYGVARGQGVTDE
jgi:hypothetical protein